ncbi:hypothetical protein X945_491 [Burkholderia pseudomallei ABCPW 107]|nr:hypothetical protein X945_491 [Burkholderia pseudomallei ABCPW 107]
MTRPSHRSRPSRLPAVSAGQPRANPDQPASRRRRPAPAGAFAARRPLRHSLAHRFAARAWVRIRRECRGRGATKVRALAQPRARCPSTRAAPTPAPIKAKAMASANALSIPLSTPMAAPKPIVESTSRRAPASPGAAHRAPRPCLPAVPSARSRATRARESPRRPSARARHPRSADIPAPSARTRAAAPARPRAPPRPRASRRPPARRVTAHRRPARPRTRADRPAGNRGAGRSPRASRSECL